MKIDFEKEALWLWWQISHDEITIPEIAEYLRKMFHRNFKPQS